LSSLYVEQSKASIKSQSSARQGELMKPFANEASKTWDWSDFYRKVAQPLPSIAEGSMEADGSKYDVDAAYSAMRSKHAWEIQNFVTAHQQACLDRVVEELALPNQVVILQAKVEALTAKHGSAYHPEAKQLLLQHARTFVELVYREEMPRVEERIREEPMSSEAVVNLARVLCLVAIVIVLLTMSHELLVRIFAVIFALGCGMTLLWEDLVLGSVRIILGETLRRMRVFGSPARTGDMLAPVRSWY